MKYLTRPFPHWLLSDILPMELALRCESQIPNEGWSGWLRYSSPWESNKRTCRSIEQMPGSMAQALGYLCSQEWTERLRTLTNTMDLVPAPFCHGGGLQVMDPDGHLDCHIDFAKHPAAPFLERRFSLIVFLSRWESDWGGELQLWNDDATAIGASYSPTFNGGVLFENSDNSYHSVGKVTGPLPRVTLAVYYCSPIRAGVSRKRALWVPRRS